MKEFIKSNDEHVKSTYLDSANRLLNYSIAVFIYSFITYFIALLYSNFDFGLIFEAIAVILVFMAKNRIKNKDIETSKLCIIIAMLPIFFLLAFDLINLLLDLEEVLEGVFRYYTSFDQFFYNIKPYIADVTLIAIILFFFKAYFNLKHAEGSVEKTYTENFYDSL